MHQAPWHPQTLSVLPRPDELLSGETRAASRQIHPGNVRITNIKRIGTITCSNSRPRRLLCRARDMIIIHDW